MNARNYQTIIELLNTVIGSLVAYAMVVTLLFSIGIAQYTMLSLLLLFIPIISRHLEHQTKHIITFLLCHIILGFIYFLLPQHIFVKIIYVVYTVIIMLYHFYRRVKSEPIENENVSFYVSLFLLIALQLYANWSEYSQLTQIIRIITLLCTILYLGNMYLINFTDFFTNDTVNAGVNFRRIKGINHTLVTGFVSITALIMIGSFSIPSSNLLSTLKSVILYLLRLFFSLFKVPTEVEEIERIEIAPITDAFPIGDTSEPNPIWLIIRQIITTIFLIAIILVVICLVVYGLYQLYKHFHRYKTDETDKKEFISPFFKESHVKNSRKTRKTLRQFFSNNNEKIRRYFYGEIKKKYKDTDKVPYHFTADELLNQNLQQNGLLLSGEPEKLDPKLLSLYHKARYSNELCTKEEVNKVKGIMKAKK